MAEFALRELVEKRGIEIAAYQPDFIVQQVVLNCEFEGSEPHFEERLIEAAIGNIQVKRYQPIKAAS
jgi:hypothetical protein